MIFCGKKRHRLPLVDLWVYRQRPENGFPQIVVLTGLAIALFLIVRKFSRLRLRIEKVKTEDAAELIEQERDNPDFVILDVRTPSEFEQGHIAVAININSRSGTFQNELKKLDKEKVYLVYSMHAERSGNVTNIMKGLGFSNVFHLAGGLSGWERQGLPVIR